MVFPAPGPHLTAISQPAETAGSRYLGIPEPGGASASRCPALPERDLLHEPALLPKPAHRLGSPHLNIREAAAARASHIVVHERDPAYGSPPEPHGHRGHRGRAEQAQPAGDSPERKAELDAIEDLGDEIATLAAHIHAATHRLLELIAEFDDRRGWELGGHRSCAHWLSYRTGIDLAERAMAAGFGGADDGECAPVSSTRAERYQVMLHVDMQTLDAEAEPGRSELEDGTRVSAETSRRLACDAALVRIGHAPDGSVLDVGRRTRTIPPALRRALEVRDRGCRFPGCNSRFTDGHHVRHWADGGETSLSNCLLLCRFHHNLVHEGGWSVDWWGEGYPVFFDPRGGTHFEGRWSPQDVEGDAHEGNPVERSDRGHVGPETREPVAALERDNRARGARPDWRTAGARGKRLEDIPDDVLFGVWEALGS